MSPTLQEVSDAADGKIPLPRGGFLTYPWSTFLNSAPDAFGPIAPRGLYGQTAYDVCRRANGTTFAVAGSFGSKMYGDAWSGTYTDPMLGSIDGLDHPVADAFGYLRQYDLGSCGASADFATIMNQTLASAVSSLKSSHGADIALDYLHVVLVPALNDTPGPNPTSVDTGPLRAKAGDSIDVRISAAGTGTASGVTCPFTFNYTFSLTPSVTPNTWYYDRFAITRSDVSGPDLSIDCSGFAWLGQALAQAMGWYFPPNPATSEQSVDASTASASDLINSDLTPPLPAADIFPSASSAGGIDPIRGTYIQTYMTEYGNAPSTKGILSPALMQPALGVDGSCLDDQLWTLDDSKCTYDGVLKPVLDGMAGTVANDLGEALRDLANVDGNLLECRPTVGGRDFANGARVVKDPVPNTNPYQGGAGWSVANAYVDVSNCGPNLGVPRLFDDGGHLIVACIEWDKSDKCHACAQDQRNCLPLSVMEQEGCIETIYPHTGSGIPIRADSPQVVCKPTDPTVEAAGAVKCLPRYNPDVEFSGLWFRDGMCVPVGSPIPYKQCEPCLALDHPINPNSATDQALIAACKQAPADCRTPNDSTGAYCTGWPTPKLVRDHKAMLLPPFRCGLRLPLSRVSVEPTRMSLIVADAYNDASAELLAAARTHVWEQYTAFLNLLPGFSFPGGFQPPACFPHRDETPVLASQMRNGHMGLIGNVHSDFTTTMNPAQCGWQ